MISFNAVSNPIAEAIGNGFQKGTPFLVDLPKDHLWEIYLETFPEGTNPIYKTRQHYDCQCCRGFVNDIGHIVFVNDQGEVTSPWDIHETLPYPFNEVAKALSETVHAATIEKPFFYYKNKLGHEFTVQSIRDKTDKKKLLKTVEWIIVYAPLSGGLCIANPMCINEYTIINFVDFEQLRDDGRIELKCSMRGGHYLFHGRVDMYSLVKTN